MYGNKPLFSSGNHWQAIRPNSSALSRKLAKATFVALDGD